MSQQVASGRFAGKLGELFSADTRSLALFRIGLGASLIVDLIARANDLTAHYTDAGSLPRKLMLPFGRLTLPLHRLSGAASPQVVLFVVAGIVAAALLVGFHTRAAAVISWLFLLSLHERNRLVLDGGDHMLMLMVFWSMFVPLGVRWSVDRRQARVVTPPPGASERRWLSFGVAALLVQSASTYLFTAPLKLEYPMWRHGTALRCALLGYHMTTSLGTALLRYPHLTDALGTAALALELIGPYLLFSPVRTGPVRTFAAFGLIFFQIGIAATMDVGNFQPSSMLFMIPFLPPWFWDQLLPRLGLGRLAALPEDDAPAPRSVPRRERALQITAGVLGAYLFLCNIGTLFSRHDLPGRPERLAYFLGIDQRWDMFVIPRRPTGWTVIPAKLQNGDEVDLLTGRAVTWDKPESPADMYNGWRWRHYIIWHIWQPYGAPYRSAYADYLCRTWNNQHPDGQRVVSVELIWMRQKTELDLTLSPPERISLYQGAAPKDAL